MAALRTQFLNLIGNPQAEEGGEPHIPATVLQRRSSRASSANIPAHVIAELKDAAVTHETLDMFARSAAVMRLSSAAGGAETAAKRIRMEKLTAALMHVKTSFDVIPYGLSVAPSDRGFGGVALAFNFYSVLFSASKQLAIAADGIGPEDAARADSTMSVGELTFLLRDFNVIPQLITRTELMFILGKRILGKEFRKRRAKHQMLVSMLKREEDELAREHHAAGLLPTSSSEHPTYKSTKGETLLKLTRQVREQTDQARVQTIKLRKERVDKLRALVSKLDSLTLNPATESEARMQHSNWEFSYTEYLEILARIAIFAFSKPALRNSRVGIPSRAGSIAGEGIPAAAITGLVQSDAVNFPLGVDKSLSPEQKVFRLLHYMGLDNPAAAKRRVMTVGAATQQYLNAPSDQADFDKIGFAGGARRVAEESKSSLIAPLGSLSLTATHERAHAQRASEKYLKTRQEAALEEMEGVRHEGQWAVDGDGNVVDTRYTMRSVLARRQEHTTSPSKKSPSTLKTTPGRKIEVEDGGVKDLERSITETPSRLKELDAPASVTSQKSEHEASGITHPPGPLLPEEAIVAEYSHELLEILRKFDYDHLSPVFKEFGGPFIDCGTLMKAHTALHPIIHDAPHISTEKIFRYRVCVTNECTDVLSVEIRPYDLPSPPLTMRIIEMADHSRKPGTKFAHFVNNAPVYPLKKSGRWDKVGVQTIVTPSLNQVTALDLAPGLSLIIELSIAPPDETAEYLGGIDVRCTSISGQVDAVSIPVYLKIESSVQKPVAPAAIPRDLRRTSITLETAMLQPKGSQLQPKVTSPPASPGKPIAPVVRMGSTFRHLQTGSTSRPAATVANAAFSSTSSTSARSPQRTTGRQNESNDHVSIPLQEWDPIFAVPAHTYRKQLESRLRSRQKTLTMSHSQTLDPASSILSAGVQALEESCREEAEELKASRRAWSSIPATSRQRIETQALESTMRYGALDLGTSKPSRPKRPLMLTKSVAPSMLSSKLSNTSALTKTAKSMDTTVDALEHFVKSSLDKATKIDDPTAYPDVLPRTAYFPA